MFNKLIRAELLSLKIPNSLATRAAKLVPSDIDGLLVYGSRARGDATPLSDLDLLAITRHPHRPINDRMISISFYTKQELLTSLGSLFTAHLRRDAKIIYDRNDTARLIMTSLRPVVPMRVIERIRHFSAIFTSLDRDLPTHLVGLLRQARYFLRSSLYAQAHLEGRECYSVREIALRRQAPELVDLLSSRPTEAPSISLLTSCLQWLYDTVGPFESHNHGCLESLIINEWYSDPELASAGLLAISSPAQELPYSEIRKVLL